MNNIILSAVELPGYLAVILLMDVWGRKPLFTLTLLFTGVSSIVSSYVTDEVDIYSSTSNFKWNHIVPCWNYIVPS